MEIDTQNTMRIHKRSGKDRRVKSGFNIRAFLFGGKRKTIRRQVDIRRIFYVDQFSPGLFFTVVSILFLCVIDALLTLKLLDNGAQEANPVMAYFLQFGPYTFFAIKYLLTVIPVICLLMFRNVVLRVIKISTRSVLYIMVVFYLTVVGLELYFISNSTYTPDLKLPPRALTDTGTICRFDNPNQYIISDQKILL